MDPWPGGNQAACLTTAVCPRCIDWLEAAGVQPAAHGELAREPALAAVEAALLAADEPLDGCAGWPQAAGLRTPPRRGAWSASCTPSTRQDGTAFQVEELAGGFQLLTRPEFHPWLVRCGAPATICACPRPPGKPWPSSPTASRSCGPTSRPSAACSAAKCCAF